MRARGSCAAIRPTRFGNSRQTRVCLRDVINYVDDNVSHYSGAYLTPGIIGQSAAYTLL